MFGSLLAASILLTNRFERAWSLALSTGGLTVFANIIFWADIFSLKYKYISLMSSFNVWWCSEELTLKFSSFSLSSLIYLSIRAIFISSGWGKNLYVEVEKRKYPVDILDKPLNKKNYKI